MDNFGVVFGAIVGGMLCGAGLVAALFFLYVRVNGRDRMTIQAASSEEATFLQTPKDPVKRSTDSLPPPIPDIYRTLEQAAPPKGGFPWLEGTGGQVVGQRIVLDREEIVMGRSRVCDVRFDDPKVSRQHAMLRLYKGHYFLQDMQSSRGTLVNNQRIQTHHLQDGDQIRMGDTMLIFHLTPLES